jgi:hypothetical protein
MQKPVTPTFGAPIARSQATHCRMSSRPSACASFVKWSAAWSASLPPNRQNRSGATAA